MRSGGPLLPRIVSTVALQDIGCKCVAKLMQQIGLAGISRYKKTRVILNAHPVVGQQSGFGAMLDLGNSLHVFEIKPHQCRFSSQEPSEATSFYPAIQTFHRYASNEIPDCGNN